MKHKYKVGQKVFTLTKQLDPTNHNIIQQFSISEYKVSRLVMDKSPDLVWGDYVVIDKNSNRSLFSEETLLDRYEILEEVEVLINR